MSLTLDVILGGHPAASHRWPRRALLTHGDVGQVVYSDAGQRRPRRARATVRLALAAWLIDFPLAG